MKIDIHTHVFNSNYLPLEGVLRSWGIPKILAKGASAIFEAATRSDSNLRGRINKLRPNMKPVVPTVDEEDYIENEALIKATADEIIELIVEETQDDPILLSDPRYIEAVSYLKEESGEKGIDKNVVFGLGRAWGSHWQGLIIKAAFRKIHEAGRLIKWLWFLTRRETAVYNTLHKTYPRIDLFVHHMMDMENHYYKDKPKYNLKTRVALTRRLESRSKGKLIGFFAYDPYRVNGVQLAKYAVEGGGFCGVKIYPPNGYRPYGNTGRDVEDAKMGIQRPISGAELDRRNLELFTYCEKKGIPVFTHCTPEGFERVKGESGKMSDPDRWEEILERVPNLNLCLGHAGGGDAWFAEGSGAPKNGSYPRKVYDLCVNSKYPNVVCGMGYLDHILQQKEADKLRERFESLLNTETNPQSEQFSNSILYGSDWHMIYKEIGQNHYMDAFDRMFSESEILKSNADKFFFGNALKFLHLSRHLEANDIVLSEAEKIYLQKLVDIPK